ncbi:MAG: cation diffusion facilitator family transporter [Actinomycetota bacterium]
MATSVEQISRSRAAGRRDLGMVLGITGGFLLVEVVAGIVSGSLALLADAGHMLHDAAALGLALVAMRFAERPATPEKTYGWYRIDILAALANGVLLVVVTVGVVWEALHRLTNPPHVRGGLMLSVAVAGLLVNVAAAAILWSRRGESPNLRAAFLHVISDALGSVAVILAAAVILTTRWELADPVASAAIALLIGFSAFRLLRHTLNVLLEATPQHIDLGHVRATMLAIDGVGSVHDLHIWTLTTRFVALSAHAVVEEGWSTQDVLGTIRQTLGERFGIEHVTVQLERADWEDEDVHCVGDPRCLP